MQTTRGFIPLGFMVTVTILVLFIVGGYYFISRTNAPITATPTTWTWTVCSDINCRQTTTIAQNEVSPIPTTYGSSVPDSGYMKGADAVYDWDPHNALGEHTLINLHADVNTFVTFPVINENYAKDKDTVWFGDVVVQGADATTFRANDYYGTDSSHAYYAGNTILGADSKTFHAIGVNYSKDANHVYFGTTTVTGADPKTIMVIDDYASAKDKAHVYIDGKVVPNADPKTYVPPEPS